MTKTLGQEREFRGGEQGEKILEKWSKPMGVTGWVGSKKGGSAP